MLLQFVPKTKLKTFLYANQAVGAVSEAIYSKSLAWSEGLCTKCEGKCQDVRNKHVAAEVRWVLYI